MAYQKAPTFHSQGRFVATRPMTFNGAQLKAGDSVDGVIPAEKLANLFKFRRIAYAETAGSAGKGKS